jgi:DNA-binding transcriptional ArsR family regulator
MKLLPKTAYWRNAEIYKVLANPKRLEILNYLKNGEASVEELTLVLKLSKANVSQHLAILRHTRLVIARRSGLNMYYQLVDSRIVEPCKIFYKLRRSKISRVF